MCVTRAREPNRGGLAYQTYFPNISYMEELRRSLKKVLKNGEVEVYGQGGLRRKDANTLLDKPSFWYAMGRPDKAQELEGWDPFDETISC